MHTKQHQVPWKVIVIVFGVLILTLLFFMIFSGKDQSAEIDQVIESSVQDQQEEGVTVEVIQAESTTYSAREYEEVELFAVDGSGSSGVARRGTSAGLFTHVIIASLPPIDTQYYFYEGWLVKPGIVDFFSTGEMFARDDGRWGLVWEVDELNARIDLDEFTQVVVTLEPRDDDSAPAPHHVLEGGFER